MIAELLEPAKIVFGLSGDFFQAIERLCHQSSQPDLAARFRSRKLDPSNEGYSYISQGIAIPHLRIDHLPAAELILGISPAGIVFNNHTVNIVLFISTPAEQPAQHLQLLQRVSSLLPAVQKELLAQRDADRALKVIARAEQQSALPTYLNLTQDQIGFELQTDLTNGLTAEEARARLGRYGPNVLKRGRRTPWYFKLLKNLFSFFAVLLWIATFLCFVPGVDLPRDGLRYSYSDRRERFIRFSSRIQI